MTATTATVTTATVITASVAVTETPTVAAERGTAQDPATGRPAAEAGPGSAVGRLPTGEPGELLLERDVPGAGRLTVRVLDPDADLDVLHSWVTRPWARFWGLGDLTPLELRDLYAYVGSLPTHHAFLVRWDDSPVALLQTYEPEHDPVGECYDVLPGDVGVHFFLGGRGPRGTDLWAALGIVLAEFLFADPAARRVVVEPDVGNARAHARMRALGFELAEPVRVGDKDALLAFLPRDRATALAARRPQARRPASA